jgi:hypothetical protein
MPVPLSILDLAPIAQGQTARDSFAASVTLARTAERTGYRRVRYAEHHNMPTIASSATSVLIGYIAAEVRVEERDDAPLSGLLGSVSPETSPSTKNANRLLGAVNAPSSLNRTSADQSALRATC